MEKFVEGGGGVAVVVDAELAADGVDGEPSGAVGEEPAATGGEGTSCSASLWVGLA